MENKTAPVVTTAPNNLRVAGGSIFKPLAHPTSTIHTIKVVQLKTNVVFVALFAELIPSIPSRTTKWRSKSVHFKVGLVRDRAHIPAELPTQ
jgi:hypothetical protein